VLHNVQKNLYHSHILINDALRAGFNAISLEGHYSLNLPVLINRQDREISYKYPYIFIGTILSAYIMVDIILKSKTISMSVNLLETIQKNLGYPALHKIDPNTQEVMSNAVATGSDKFSQAAIPAIVTGLYKYAQSDEGAKDILVNGSSSNWVSKIFDENRKAAVQTISSYAKQPGEDPIARMNAIANEAVKVTKESLPAGATIKDVKVFFTDQIDHILLYLPAALNMGELLHDASLDDNTHKMEGPISSLIHSIGAAFSNPVTGEEIKNS
jgi:hypothetical protein